MNRRAMCEPVQIARREHLREAVEIRRILRVRLCCCLLTGEEQAQEIKIP
jgi:hypothetical protein